MKEVRQSDTNCLFHSNAKYLYTALRIFQKIVTAKQIHMMKSVIIPAGKVSHGFSPKDNIKIK